MIATDVAARCVPAPEWPDLPPEFDPGFYRADNPDLAARVAAAIEEHAQASGYLDAEAWHFTPESFRDLTAIVFHLGLSPLAPVRVWSTPFQRDEFCAVLERS